MLRRAGRNDGLWQPMSRDASPLALRHYPSRPATLSLSSRDAFPRVLRHYPSRSTSLRPLSSYLFGGVVNYLYLCARYS